MALISIITPVYNSERYLEQCITSILAQTFTDFELILVDDGSTDGSRLIMEKYSDQDDRIIVIEQENGGVAVARNTGLQKASGKYIMWVDSDDWVEPNAVATLYEETVQSKLPVIVVKSKEYANHYNSLEGNELIFAFLDGFIPSEMWTTIFKREDYAGILFKNYSIGEDAMMLIELFSKVNKVHIINNDNYHYRINENSITNKPSEKVIISWIDEVENQRRIIVDRYPIAKSKMNYKSMLFSLDIIHKYRDIKLINRVKPLLVDSFKNIRIMELSKRQRLNFINQIIKNWRLIFC